MRYDRDAAIAYARKYWDRPCDDGIFWRSDYAVDIEKMRHSMGAPAQDGWEVRFVPDGKGTEHAVFQRSVQGTIQEKEIQEWAGLADCAHFLTRCMRAGGIPISEISVPRMIEHLKKRHDVKVLAEQVTRAKGQRIIDTRLFKKADMLGYFNIDPTGDYGGRRQYSHSTMYVGKIDRGDVGRITCHTKSRFAGLSSFPDEWHLDSDSYTYTFIHIARDDATSLSVASGLHGWWQESDGARTYYHLTPNGRARLAIQPPRSRLDVPGTSFDTAYWFLRGGRITFFWRRRGDVEVWIPTGRPNDFTTVFSGASKGHVAKMVHFQSR